MMAQPRHALQPPCLPASECPAAVSSRPPWGCSATHRRRDIASGFDARQTFELGVWSVIRLCLHLHRTAQGGPRRSDTWQGLTRFIDDGRIELDNNTVERSIRGIKLNRKNALFAGSDGGAEHWAVVASLTETCKLKDVDPLAYFTDVLTRIVNGHPNRDIDQLLPWAYREQSLKAVA
jgi:transposase